MKKNRHDKILEIIEKHEIETQGELAQRLRDSVLSVDTAQNILVIKTGSGMAMAAAAALDNLKLPEVVGSIAGDDTIMAAVRTADETVYLMEKISRMLEEE